LKALADPNRLRILNLLGEGTLCVCDLEDVLRLNQSNLSRHLARLKQVGLVTVEKRGLFAYYSRKPVGEPYGHVVEELYSTVTKAGLWNDDTMALKGRTSCSPTA